MYRIALYKTFRYQRGGVTLITALVLLVAITLVTIFASRTAVMEQKMTGNEIRAKQAFEAAQAGMEHMMAYAADGGVDHDNDGTIDMASSVTATLSNLAAYTAQYCAPASALPTCSSVTDFNNVLIYAVGRSGDGTASRTLTQIVRTLPATPNIPTNPLVSRETVNVGGSGMITNPEGNATIWSGGNIDIENATAKTRIPDPGDPSKVVDSSAKGLIGADVIANDKTLAALSGDEFFGNFFGMKPAQYKALVASVQLDLSQVGTSTGTLNGMTNEIIWVEPSSVGGTVQLQSNSTIGTANNPVILIVNGNLEAQGNVTVNGILYVTESFVGSGSLDVNGAVLVQAGMGAGATGSLDVWYNSAILGRAGRLGPGAMLAGTWKDW